MLVTHMAQSDSKPATFFQYVGNWAKRNFFSCCTSSIGSAGSSLQPTTVHFAKTSGPKKASRANLTARVPILHSVLSL